MTWIFSLCPKLVILPSSGGFYVTFDWLNLMQLAQWEYLPVWKHIELGKPAYWCIVWGSTWGRVCGSVCWRWWKVTGKTINTFFKFLWVFYIFFWIFGLSVILSAQIKRLGKCFPEILVYQQLWVLSIVWHKWYEENWIIIIKAFLFKII